MPNFFDKYPYTDFHELNLDWIIKTVKETVAEWAVTLTEWHNTQEEWQQLYDYVHDYFDNLDVQQEINNKLDAMALDGTLATIAQPIIDAKVADLMPGTVADQIGGTVASQISPVVASQLPGVVNTSMSTVAPPVIESWLADHITQPTTPAIDTSLSVAGAAADAKATGDALLLRQNVSATFNDISDCNLITNNSIHVFNTSTNGGSLSNTPFDDWKDGQIWVLDTKETSLYAFQTMYSAAIKGRSASRMYTKGSSTWSSWIIKFDFHYIKFNDLTDCNLITDNSVFCFNAANNGGTLNNAPFNDWKDGQTWVLETYQVKPNVALSTTYVWQKMYCLAGGRRSALRFQILGGSWIAWDIFDNAGKTVIEIGSGKPYTTLKAGIAAANSLGNCNVIVYDGTYDLSVEFATEIANHSSRGMYLGYNNYYQFKAGAKITCMLDDSDSWVHTNFSPFNCDASDFILDGAVIEASNTRYCIHDELSGSGIYKHSYVNCVMKYSSDYNPPVYVACIGGGMGHNGYINIEGGMYESDPTYAQTGYTLDESQQPISWHNGGNGTADHKIFINNVYLKNKGHFRFGYYGNSQIKSPVLVSNCSMGDNIEMMYEPGALYENFELTEWNNTIR